MNVAKVAVENTAYQFDKIFDYLVPLPMQDALKAGCRVMIPFGAGNKKRLGMVLELNERTEVQNLKSISAVLDRAPLLNQEMIFMVYWLKEHYYCTLFEAAKLLLPTGINLKLQTKYSLKNKLEQLNQLDFSEDEWNIIFYLSHKKKAVNQEIIYKDLALPSESGLLDKLFKEDLLQKQTDTIRQIGDAVQKMVRLKDDFPRTLPKCTPKQNEALKVLQDVGCVSQKELGYFTGCTISVINALVAKGLAEYYDSEVYRNPYQQINDSAKEDEIILSEEQNAAFLNLYQEHQKESGSISLLYGITGSGKTSVFMKLIDQIVPSGQGIIVMVPEISLTPQTLAIFHRRYGKRIAVFHSGLSLAERLDEWKRVKNGEATIAIGTRSAVFAPFQKISLIIMDEEQEYTYKSESSPRYHARDIAKFRCAYHNSLLILSSATPSLESYFFALAGKYSFNKLSSRYGSATLPNVTVVDMNRELENGNTSVLSSVLLNALKQNLTDGKQSIVLLNRRGYHTFATCKACGKVVTCPNCSISMTYHTANNRLMCHYCGYSIPFTQECPQCHEKEIRYSGLGTQRAEQQLTEALPRARILRLDADSTSSKYSFEKKLELFTKGEYDIIIGTQMVAKGLDFENVTLVGVLSADQLLYSDDFRSSERAFDLLTQVVGRSGRGKYMGSAIIQTFTPENSIISLAALQDYPAFYQDEIKFRKAMLYPPFADIVVIGFVGNAELKVQEASFAFLNLISTLAKEEYSKLPLRILSPSSAAVSKVSNKYRYKLIIKCRNDMNFRSMLSKALLEFSKNREFSTVTAFADSNPDIIM